MLKKAKVMRFLRILGVIAFCLVYPVLSVIAAQDTQPNLLGAIVALMPFLAVGLWLAWRSAYRWRWCTLFAIIVALIGWQKELVIANYSYINLVQHAGMQALLCYTFATSLIKGKTAVITRFASFAHSHMSEERIRYTRQVTMAWSLFFGSIASISLLLFVFSPYTLWSAFANMGTPILITCMFIVEYLIRCRVLPANERSSISDTIKAIKASTEGRAHTSNSAQ